MKTFLLVLLQNILVDHKDDFLAKKCFPLKKIVLYRKINFTEGY